MSSEPLIVEDPALIAEIAGTARRVVVLGIKPESRADQPAHYVPRYLVDHGVEIIPLPVYYPDVKEILGLPVVRSLDEVGPPIDVVCVFRRSEDVSEHLQDLLELRPQTVWMQTGIRDDATARKLAEAGIQVVQDHCLMVEHRRATN